MKALVIYDSVFGNTQKVADIIAKELKAKVLLVSDAPLDELDGFDLIVVGSPINGWRPTEKIIAFLANLGSGRLKNVKAAAFDTRVRLFIHGDAAAKISQGLEKAGARIVASPKAFFVRGKQGPLLDGEFEKAADWARAIEKSLNK